MARTLITLNELDYNTASTVTATDVDITNSHYIDLNDADAQNLALVFHGSTADMAVTIKAGTFSDATLGDLEFTVGDGDITAVNIESARFKDADGYVLIDVSGATADGTIEAIVLP